MSERKRIAVGESLPEAVEHPQRMQRPVSRKILRAREHDFLELAGFNSLQGTTYRRAIIARFTRGEYWRLISGGSAHSQS